MCSRFFLLLFCKVGLLATLSAQTLPERCQFRLKQSAEQRQQFEKLLQRAMRQQREIGEETHYRIPIIFHIVHNGEPVGEGANVAAAQVYSQIEVLNEDFNRLNADTALINPDFKKLSSEIGITFEPALLSPSGEILTEPGIHRYESKITAFNIDNYDKELKIHTIWNPEEYVNVWVVPPIGNFLGAAQFPVATGLPGIEDELSRPTTEGVAVAYRALGRAPENPFDSPYNQGRTLTHELGHWLGLFHPWGPDVGGCTQDDFCEDTPNVGAPNFACLTEPVTSCGNIRMHENFMEYTEDACMGLFTHDQKARMLAAMEIGEFRSVLQESTVAPDSAIVARFSVNQRRVCRGETLAFSAEVQALGVSSESVRVQWLFPNGTPDASSERAPTVRYDVPGRYTATLIAQAAAVSDTFQMEILVRDVPETLPTEVSTNFEETAFPPEGWLLEGEAWQKSDVGKQSATSLYLPNYYQNLKGKIGKFRAPVVATEGRMFTEVFFEYAYATWRGSDAADTLAVYYRTDCEQTFQLLWQDSGETLANGRAFQNELRPFQNSNWRAVSLQIPTINTESLEVMWVGKGAFGNNIHIDNLSVRPFTGIVPAFTTATQWICAGDSIQFADTSRSFSSDTLRREWYFEGGMPSYSTNAAPLVQYPQAGIFSVRLVSLRADGTVAELLQERWIKVAEPAPETISLSEDFESQVFIDWNELSGTWNTQPVGAYETSERSTSPLTNASLLSRTLSTQTTDWVKVEFDYAVASATVRDTLTLFYSADCGKTFRRLWQALGDTLNTFSPSTLRSAPNFLEWNTQTLYLRTDSLASSILFRFDVQKDDGTVYLDNLRASAVNEIEASFTSDRTLSEICIGTSVQFMATPRLISGAPLQQVQWEFEGAIPSQTTALNPKVTYNQAGTFGIKLIMQTAQAADTLTLPEAITVTALEELPTVLNATFEQGDAAEWQSLPVFAWKVDRQGGAYGQSFTTYTAENAYFARQGFRARLVSPAINLVEKNSATVSFDVAYLPREAIPSDTLCVLYSLNCGEDFREWWCGTANELATGIAPAASIRPTSAQWQTLSFDLDMLNPAQTDNALRLAFENRSAANHTFYIDNVKVTPFSFEIPIADFMVDFPMADSLFVEEDTVQFLDLSTRRPRSWLWEITGPETFTFTEQTPKVVFRVPGTYRVTLTVENPAGSATVTKELSVFSREPLSIEQSHDDNFRIYPNPAQTHLFVEGVPPKTQLTFLNAMGNRLFTGQVVDSQLTVIPLEKFPSGVYILKLNFRSMVLCKRVIIR